MKSQRRPIKRRDLITITIALFVLFGCLYFVAPFPWLLATREALALTVVLWLGLIFLAAKVLPKKTSDSPFSLAAAVISFSVFIFMYSAFVKNSPEDGFFQSRIITGWQLKVDNEKDADEIELVNQHDNDPGQVWERNGLDANRIILALLWILATIFSTVVVKHSFHQFFVSREAGGIIKFVESRDLFVSHAQENLDLLKPFLKELRELDVSLWIDANRVRAGETLPGRISEGITRSKMFLAVVSENYVQSVWCQHELSLALTQEIESGTTKVIPIAYGKRESLIKKLPAIGNKLFLDGEDCPRENANKILAMLIKLGEEDIQSIA